MGVVHVEAFLFHATQPADSTTAILPPHRCIEEPIVTALALGFEWKNSSISDTTPKFNIAPKK